MKIFQGLHGLLLLDVVSAATVASKNFKLKKFSSLVIFGDSYTDQGVYQYRPGSDGTVGTPKTVTSTGGRIWPQYINQYSGVNIYDYAVSGAVCNTAFSPTRRSGILQNQMPEFLADNEWVNSTTGQKALNNPADETLYAIWIGTNDIGPRAFFTDLQPAETTLNTYIECVYQQLDTLYKAGARNFVILNIAPLQLAPQFAPPGKGGLDNAQFWETKFAYNPNITQSTEKMRQYSSLINSVYNYQTAYEVKLSGRYPKSSIALFDVNSLIANIYNKPTDYLNGTAPLNVTGNLVRCKASACPSADSPDSFLWYDDLHPSEQTGRIIAKEFLNLVQGKSSYAKYWSN